MIALRTSHLVVLMPLLIGCASARALASLSSTGRPAGTGMTTVAVTGTGVDRLDTAIVHSKQSTPTGIRQTATETVELSGDLKGRVLYHVTSVFDFVHSTLVNTGEQVYSGTIAGSAPVMIHDDQFRFEVNLATGEERGRVYLFNHIAGPKVRCTLEVVGTGLTPEGNPAFSYTGTCSFRGE